MSLESRWSEQLRSFQLALVGQWPAGVWIEPRVTLLCWVAQLTVHQVMIFVDPQTFSTLEGKEEEPRQPEASPGRITNLTSVAL